MHPGNKEPTDNGVAQPLISQQLCLSTPPIPFEPDVQTCEINPLSRDDNESAAPISQYLLATNNPPYTEQVLEVFPQRREDIAIRATKNQPTAVTSTLTPKSYDRIPLILPASKKFPHTELSLPSGSSRCHDTIGVHHSPSTAFNPLTSVSPPCHLPVPMAPSSDGHTGTPALTHPIMSNTPVIPACAASSSNPSVGPTLAKAISRMDTIRSIVRDKLKLKQAMQLFSKRQLKLGRMHRFLEKSACEERDPEQATLPAQWGFTYSEDILRNLPTGATESERVLYILRHITECDISIEVPLENSPYYERRIVRALIDCHCPCNLISQRKVADFSPLKYTSEQRENYGETPAGPAYSIGRFTATWNCAAIDVLDPRYASAEFLVMEGNLPCDVIIGRPAIIEHNLFRIAPLMPTTAMVGGVRRLRPPVDCMIPRYMDLSLADIVVARNVPADEHAADQRRQVESSRTQQTIALQVCSSPPRMIQLTSYGRREPSGPKTTLVTMPLHKQPRSTKKRIMNGTVIITTSTRRYENNSSSPLLPDQLLTTVYSIENLLFVSLIAIWNFLSF